MTVLLREPATLEEAAGILTADPGARLVAGGVTVCLQITHRRSDPSALVLLRRVPGLSGVTVLEDGSLEIGALTTHGELAADPELAARHPRLTELFSDVGNVRVRAAGTIGGNLANADPAQDPAVLLAVIGAEADTVSPRGERTVPIAGLSAGAWRSTLAADEVIRRVRVPRLPPTSRTGWSKIQSGSLDDYATVNAGVRMEVGADGTIASVRAVVGAAVASPRVFDIPALAGSHPGDTPALKACAREATADLETVTDHRGSADYRRHLAGVALGRALTRCLDDDRRAA